MHSDHECNILTVATELPVFGRDSFSLLKFSFPHICHSFCTGHANPVSCGHNYQSCCVLHLLTACWQPPEIAQLGGQHPVILATLGLLLGAACIINQRKNAILFCHKNPFETSMFPFCSTEISSSVQTYSEFHSTLTVNKTACGSCLNICMWTDNRQTQNW